MTRKSLIFAAAAIAMATTGAQAQTMVTALNQGTGPHALTTTEYTQNFNTLAPTRPNAITPDTLPSGWQAYEESVVGAVASATADGAYNVGSNTSTNVGLWSYGTGGNTERALGGRVSPDLPFLSFGAIFTNALGGVIDSLTINYTGEQWHNGFNRATLVFQYSLDATNITNGNWTSFSGLNFLAPDASPHSGLAFQLRPADGNSAAFQSQISGLISGLEIAEGATFGLRWTLSDIGPGANTDDGLAIDNFRLSATLAPAVGAVPEPATWAMMIGGFGVVGGAMRRRKARARMAIA